MSEGYDPSTDHHEDPYAQHDAGAAQDTHGDLHHDPGYGADAITVDYGHGTETVIDTDHDGHADIVDIDANGDGHIDAEYSHTFGPGQQLDTLAVDTDGDGRPDLVEFDSNHDGRIDEVALDRNHDGRVDELVEDTNFDGRPDVVQVDDNFDGKPDFEALDSDHDGQFDTVHYDDPAHSPLANLNAGGTGGGTAGGTAHAGVDPTGAHANPYAKN